jgi:hypothetical protein
MFVIGVILGICLGYKFKEPMQNAIPHTLIN